MYKSRIGLSADVRTTVIEVLQKNLAALVALRLDVKQAHWTVRGPRFQQLHELFDTFVSPLDEEIDTIAERIATLSGVPDGRAITAANTTIITDYPLNLSSEKAHLDALIDRFARVGDLVRDSIDQTDEAGDADSADIVTGTSRFLDQSLWFLEAHTG